MGHNLWEEFPGAVQSKLFEHYHRVAATGKAVRFEIAEPRTKRSFEFHAFPHEEGVGVEYRETTAQRQAQRAMVQQFAAERQERQWLERTAKRHELVAALTRAAFRDPDATHAVQVLVTTCRQIFQAQALRLTWLLDNRTRYFSDGDPQPGADRVAIPLDVDQTSRALFEIYRAAGAETTPAELELLTEAAQVLALALARAQAAQPSTHAPRLENETVVVPVAPLRFTDAVA
jgi:K+-sensing histidine kinase KdpD